MARNKGTFNFASNFEVLTKAPLDARMRVDTKADLTLPATWQDGNSNIWLYDGAIVSVARDSSVENNGIWFLKLASGYDQIDNWEKAGTGSDGSTGIVNIGDGSANIFKGWDSSGNAELLSISGTDAIEVSIVGDQIIIGVDASYGGEVNTASNIGTDSDASLFYQKSISDLEFRGLKGTENIIISVSEGSNNIVIDTSVDFVDIYNKIDEKLDASGGIITGNLQIDGSLFVGGDTKFDGSTNVFNNDVQIGGSLTIDGSLLVRHVESIDVSSAFIQLNTGELGIPPDYMQSGIVVNRGTEDPYVFIYDESNETFRIGTGVQDASGITSDASTQSVATRQDNPIDNAIAVWNDTVSRFDTSNNLVFDASGLYVDGSVKITSLAGTGVRFVTADEFGSLDVSTLPNYVLEASLGSTLEFDASGFLQVDTSATGSGKYDTLLDDAITMPSAVGGYSAGTSVSELKGDTLIKMWDDLLFPTITPTIHNPYSTFTDNVASILLAGSSQTITFTGGLNRGSIRLNNVVTNPASGLAVQYHYTDPSGNTLLTNTITTDLSDPQTITGYLVEVGSNTFTVNVDYSEGPQPLDNKGVAVGSPLPAGTTTPSSQIVIEGVYPIYTTYPSIAAYTTIPLVSMGSSSIDIYLAPQTNGENSGPWQAFSLPTAWTNANPLTNIQTYDTTAESWKQEGGSIAVSLGFWDASVGVRDIGGESISYTDYVYNGTDRDTIEIRLIF